MGRGLFCFPSASALASGGGLPRRLCPLQLLENGSLKSLYIVPVLGQVDLLKDLAGLDRTL